MPLYPIAARFALVALFLIGLAAPLSFPRAQDEEVQGSDFQNILRDVTGVEQPDPTEAPDSGSFESVPAEEETVSPSPAPAPQTVAPDSSSEESASVPPQKNDPEPAPSSTGETSQTTPPATEIIPMEDPAPSFLDLSSVRLQTLDKATARTMTFEARVGSTVQFGPIFIKIRSCRSPPPEERKESAAFLQIWENDIKTGEAHWVFSGWMFASSPALSSMDHPIYDVWVVECLPDAQDTTRTNGPASED